MKNPHEQLLQVILETNELKLLRSRSVEQMIAQARHRRYRKMAYAAVAVSSIIGVALTFQFTGERTQTTATLAKPVMPSVGASTPVESGTIPYISTDELLALFPNRPLALVGRPGSQKLVFLDEEQ